jgi:RNA recognition motif-containing protein
MIRKDETFFTVRRLLTSNGFLLLLLPMQDSRERKMPSKHHKLISDKTAHYVSKFAARRLFLGNLPANVTEHEVREVFRRTIREALVPGQPKYETLYHMNHIFGVYLAERKGPAQCGFIEFTTREMCTACLVFDNVTMFEGFKPIQIRRSAYFDADRARCAEIPLLRLSNAMIPAPKFDSLTQIFVRGIPFELTRDQAFELLEQFGEVKSFQMPAGSKKWANNGYFFFEFVDDSLIPEAIKKLDGFVSPLTQGRYLKACLAKEPNLVQYHSVSGVPTNKKSSLDIDTSSEELWPMLPQRSSPVTPVSLLTPKKNKHTKQTVSHTCPSSIPSFVSLSSKQFSVGQGVGERAGPSGVSTPPGFIEQGSSFLSTNSLTEDYSSVSEPLKGLADSQKCSNVDIVFSKSLMSHLHGIEPISKEPPTTASSGSISNFSMVELGGVNSIDNVFSNHDMNLTHTARYNSTTDSIAGIQAESVPPVSSQNSWAMGENLFPWMWDHGSRPRSPFAVINGSNGETSMKATNTSNVQQPKIPKTIRRPNATAMKSRVFVQFELLGIENSINGEALESAVRGACTGFGTLQDIHISRMPYIDGEYDRLTSSVNFHDGFLTKMLSEAI